MSKRYTGSIRTKVILITLICTTLILAAVGIFDALQVVDQERKRLRDLAGVTAERLAQHLMLPVWDLDKERVDSALEAEMLEKNLQAIVVYDEDGSTIMSAKERDHNWQVAGSSGSIASSFAQASAEIVSGAQVIGRVDVHVSDHFIQQEVQAQVVLEIVRALLLNVAILLVLLLLLGRFLIAPIRRLAEQASDISSGQLNTVIDVKSNDELGLLADSVTRMQKSLIVAFKKIRQANKLRENQDS